MQKTQTAELKLIPLQAFDRHQSVPDLVPNLQVLPADFGLAGDKRHFFLAIHPKGYRLRLSQQAYDLVALLQETSATISYEQAAQRLSESWHISLDAYTLYRKVMTILAPVGLLADNPTPASRPRDMLAFKIPLLPPSLVTSLVHFLTWLYHPLIAIPICCLASLITLIFLFKGMPNITTMNATPQTLFWTYILCLCSILWHELGHATACRRFHAPLGPIGFCLYIIFPAFYTDVSGIWQLSRKQRAIVDLGGIYFQSMVLLLFYGLYLLTASQLYLFAVASIVGSILFSLNPFLRFDGYWMVTDLLGLIALDQLQQAINSACIHSLRQGKGRMRQTLQALRMHMEQAIPETTPTWLKLSLLIYVLVTNIFWLWFFIKLFYWLSGLFQTYPGQVAMLLFQVQHQSWMAAGYTLGKILIPCFALFGLISLILRLTKNGSRSFLPQKPSNTSIHKEI
ncbi:hypothetical protein EPA93_17490 [Ktedonosporobacter rubrisoli]|uniref:Peptide zinc metalloprotease protein n=1 Tax=Ktedonosporobacter rubrisoli TaxID=2509675 RepID=A0A4P6JS62_KTERU|nr:hypothetical protein [Ktedonosporobacter rubrisoli]QBD77686.1 hypothetical protein EPA93_17490 [Ktedonosporobacter rubrisoli]